jgi:hypothetical protein
LRTDALTLYCIIYLLLNSLVCFVIFSTFILFAGLDLLRKKSLSEKEGVTKLHNPRGLQLHGNFSGYKVPRSRSQAFLHKLYGDFSLHLSGHLTGSSRGSVLVVRHPHRQLPFLDLQFDLERNVMTLRYLGSESYQRIDMPGVFLSSPWSQVQVDLVGRTLTVHVDCQLGAKVQLRQGLGTIPADAYLFFGERLEESGLQVMYI